MTRPHDRPHDTALDYYAANETDYRSTEMIAMLAIADAIIDQRKAIEQQSHALQESLDDLEEAIRLCELTHREIGGGR